MHGNGASRACTTSFKVHFHICMRTMAGRTCMIAAGASLGNRTTVEVWQWGIKGMYNQLSIM